MNSNTLNHKLILTFNRNSTFSSVRANNTLLTLTPITSSNFVFFNSTVASVGRQYVTYSTSASTKLALQHYNAQGATALRCAFPAIIYAVTPNNDGMLIRTSAKALRAVSLQIRHKTYLQFRSLIDIAVVDRLRAPARFSINYLFLSATTNQRAIVQLFADETSTIPSLAVPYANGQRYFASAGWLEREAWDMFGVYFSEHGDLRRILTDYGFTGHPLRKDFPLTGFHELVYNDAQGRVVSTHVELSQEFRVFSYA